MTAAGPPLPWYDDHGGDRPVLVLLHAFPLSSQMWGRLVPLLTDHVRVVPVDLPGLGRSARPAAEPSVDALATAVLAVLDALDVDRATLMGLSTGGYVALAAAALAPERVTALVLASTTCWVIEPDVPGERRGLADTLERDASVAVLLDDADAGLGPTAQREQPELADLLRDVVAATDPLGAAWAARAIAGRADTSVVLASYAGPVLLLFGDEDGETPLDRAVAMLGLRDGVGTARTELTVLPGTGHLTALEQPAAVADVLLAFLA